MQTETWRINIRLKQLRAVEENLDCSEQLAELRIKLRDIRSALTDIFNGLDAEVYFDEDE
jgi:hypothetical protein